MRVLHQMEFIVLGSSDHQGKFHLLGIFLIPALLVSFFLSNHWWIPVIVLLISIILIAILFKKKK